MPHRPAEDPACGLLSVLRLFPWEVTRGAGSHPLTDEKRTHRFTTGGSPRGATGTHREPPRGPTAAAPRPRHGPRVGGAVPSMAHTLRAAAAEACTAEDGPGRRAAAYIRPTTQGSGAAHQRPRTRRARVTTPPHGTHRCARSGSELPTAVNPRTPSPSSRSPVRHGRGYASPRVVYRTR